MMNTEPPTNILATLVAKFPFDELYGLLAILFGSVIYAFVTS
jgi:hypothetical protein